MASGATIGSVDQVALFAALTAEDDAGYRPFRWQMRLLRRFVEGDLPAAVDVPTGLGKTSVMALWLMALAAGADLPRRLVYVVDRRAVVDQATRFAERLRRNLPSTLAGDLGHGDRPLPISTLRGGFADNRDWLEDPSRPAIVVGTVDMIGSRLLFAGYGVSRRMRPYHAGFLGADTLVVLDEAHLCPPFEALLRDVATGRDSVFGPTGRAARAVAAAPPPLRLMSLSATGRKPAAVAPAAGDPIFRLQDEDHDDAAVRERVTARKRLALVRIGDPKSLADELAQHAAALGDDPPARVLVYCDSRRVALQVRKGIERAIQARAKSEPRSARGVCELLVGERRAYEHETLERWLEHHGFLGGAQSDPPAPTFLVATSAGEVGVDLDADHLVCDLVAYERMVQRLGRVNRRGGATRSAHVDVLIPRADGKDQAELDARMAVLAELARDADGRYDASPQATVRLRSGTPAVAALIERATTPAPLYPELTRPLVEAWAMTSLSEHAGRPEVEPWLRGWEEEAKPHTAVVWRRYLPRLRVVDDASVAAAERLVASFFDSAPIHVTERLEAVTSHVTSWLIARAEQVRRRPVDHEQAVRAGDIIAVVLDRAGDVVAAATLYEVLSAVRNRNRTRRWERSLSGATLIVDSALCGLADGMLDEGSEEPVTTADADEDWQRIPEGPGSDRPMVRFRVQPFAASPDGDGLQAAAELDGWRHVRSFETEFDGDGEPRGGLAVFAWADDAPNEDARSVRAKPQTLRDHAHQVAARVREMAARLGLPAAEADALLRAAQLHDEGKAARRWQDAMNAPQAGRPYAKTRSGGDWRLLEHYRHEFGSLLKAERTSLPAETRDLILHLVAAHHGHARPLITTAGCQEAPPSVLAATVREAALRYARLQRRYGLWGLAWREAILRAADQSASREGVGDDG